MKKIFISLILLLTILSTSAFAFENILNAVVVEGTPNGNNLILRTDTAAVIKKSILSDGTLEVDIKNIAASMSMDTKYINPNGINNVTIENIGNNEVKIFVQGENADRTSIIFDTPASAPIVVSDGLSKKQIGWIATVFILTCILAGSFKHSVEKDERVSIKNDLTEREIKLYKELKSDIIASAKIDNMIKQRITKRINNSVKRADTIRAMQKMALK